MSLKLSSIMIVMVLLAIFIRQEINTFELTIHNENDEIHDDDYDPFPEPSFDSVQRDFGSGEMLQPKPARPKRRQIKAIFELMLNVLETLQSAAKIDDDHQSRKREVKRTLEWNKL